jgi:hypothetical protein
MATRRDAICASMRGSAKCENLARFEGLRWQNPLREPT